MEVEQKDARQEEKQGKMMEGMITLLPLISGWRLRINNSWWQIQGQPSRDNPIFTHTLAGTRCSPETFSFFFLLPPPAFYSFLLLSRSNFCSNTTCLFYSLNMWPARSLARHKSGSLGARRQAKWKCTSCASFKSAFKKKQSRAELDMRVSILRSLLTAATDRQSRFMRLSDCPPCFPPLPPGTRY